MADTHKSSSYEHDFLPGERFEDVLLDSDNKPEAVSDSLRAMATDAALQKRVVDRLFIHGLLHSLHDQACVERQQRLNRALERLRAIDRAPVFGLHAALRRVAALVLCLGLLSALALASAAPQLDGTNGAVDSGFSTGRDAAIQMKAVGDTSVRSRELQDGSLLVASASIAASFRVLDDALVTLAPLSAARIDASGSTIHLLRGECTIEGSLFTATIGESQVASQRSLVYANVETASLGLLEGRATNTNGQALPTLERLPMWAAAGRAHDVLDEFEILLGHPLERGPWLAILNPILAAPETRTQLESFLQDVVSAGFSEEEIRDDLSFLNELLTLADEVLEQSDAPLRERSARMVAHVVNEIRTASEEELVKARQQRRMALNAWKNASERQREMLRGFIRQSLNRYLQALPGENAVENPAGVGD